MSTVEVKIGYDTYIELKPTGIEHLLYREGIDDPMITTFMTYSDLVDNQVMYYASPTVSNAHLKVFRARGIKLNSGAMTHLLELRDGLIDAVQQIEERIKEFGDVL